MSIKRERFTSLFDTASGLKLGFADAVIISGIGARQLRNGLEREVLKVGQKLPSVGRWAFSLPDCLQLMIIGELTNKAWVPISHAADIAGLISNSFDVWGTRVLHAMADFADGKDTSIYELIASSEEGRPRVLLHVRGGDWGFYDLKGAKLEDINYMETHVRLPAFGLIERLISGLDIAMGERKDRGEA